MQNMLDAYSNFQWYVNFLKRAKNETVIVGVKQKL